MRTKFQPMGGLKLRIPRNVTLHLKFSVQGMPRGEMTWIALLSFVAEKVAHFSSPPEFASSPPFKVGLIQILGGCLAKILIANPFFIS
jgi:hypothetical protein